MHTSGYRRNHHRHEVGWHVKDRDSGNRHLDDGGAVTLYDVPKFKGRENHGEAKAHGRRLSAGLAEPFDLKLRFLTDADTRQGLVAVRRTELTFPIRASIRCPAPKPQCLQVMPVTLLAGSKTSVRNDMHAKYTCPRQILSFSQLQTGVANVRNY